MNTARKTGVWPACCRLVKNSDCTYCLRTALVKRQNENHVLAVSAEVIDPTDEYDSECIAAAFRKPILKLEDYPVITLDRMFDYEEQAA
jgi:hypothetical protein